MKICYCVNFSLAAQPRKHTDCQKGPGPGGGRVWDIRVHEHRAGYPVPEGAQHRPSSTAATALRPSYNCQWLVRLQNILTRSGLSASETRAFWWCAYHVTRASSERTDQIGRISVSDSCIYRTCRQRNLCIYRTSRQRNSCTFVSWEHVDIETRVHLYLENMSTKWLVCLYNVLTMWLVRCQYLRFKCSHKAIKGCSYTLLRDVKRCTFELAYKFTYWKPCITYFICLV